MPFAPTDISGLQAWFKADANVYSDLGSTPSTNGGIVEQWNDQSGNANNLTQSNINNVGIYTTGDINGLPTVGAYPAGGTMLNFGSGIALTGAFTLYVVGKRTNSTIWAPLAVAGSTTCVIYSDNNLYVVNDANSNVNAAAAVTGTFAFRVRRDGSNVVKAAWTGQAEFTVGTLSGTLTILQSIGKAAQTSTGGDSFGEIALYNVATTGGDDSSFNTYLNGRWGVSVEPPGGGVVASPLWWARAYDLAGGF